MTRRNNKSKKKKSGGTSAGTPGAGGAGPASSSAAGEGDAMMVVTEEEEVKVDDMEVGEVKAVAKQDGEEKQESAPSDKGAAASLSLISSRRGAESSQSSGSTLPSRSWRNLVTGGVDARLKENFVKFIQTYKFPGHNSPSFMPLVLGLANGSSTKLNVSFIQLLDGYRQDNDLLALCLRIGNSDSNTWLTVTIGDLLKEWIQDESFGDTTLTREVEIEFQNKPSSIAAYKSLLKDTTQPNAKRIKLLSGRNEAYAATNHGKFPLKVAVSSLITHFRQDRYFQGNFDIKEFFLINNQICYICKTPVQMSSLDHLPPNDAKKIMADGKASNIKSLWDVFEPYYLDGKYLPIYLEILKRDMTSVTRDNITEDWFLLYLEDHFSWGSSMCRKTFTCDAQLTCKVFDLDSGGGGIKSILSMQPPGKDWRLQVMRSGDKLLIGVYWYGIDLDDCGLGDIAGDIERGDYRNIHGDIYKRAHANTIAALLDYKRNLIQHLKDHLQREAEQDKSKVEKSKVEKNKIQDFDEIELFASSSLARAEPVVLRYLVEKNPLQFASLMSFYKAGLSDRRDLPRT